MKFFTLLLSTFLLASCGDKSDDKGGGGGGGGGKPAPANRVNWAVTKPGGSPGIDSRRLNLASHFETRLIRICHSCERLSA